LPKNAVIGIVAPASPLDEAAVERAVQKFRARGHRVKLSLGYRQARGYLASDDEVRAAELNGFFADPQVDAIVCLRGGYGSPRILDRIDYDLIRKNPKIFVGYSDITALLNAIHQRSGLVTFHGPMAVDFGRGGVTKYAENYFWPAFAPRTALFDDWGRGGPAGRSRLVTLVAGQADGVLVGGNLSVLVATIGTPYEVRAEGAILFLEDVGEKPFRIDRMLNQLRLSGKLARFEGVILGSFSGCRGNAGVTVDDVLDEYFGRLRAPVLKGFPTGHISDQVTLPVGLRVRLDASAKRVALLESAVSAK